MNSPLFFLKNDNCPDFSTVSGWQKLCYSSCEELLVNILPVIVPGNSYSLFLDSFSDSKGSS